MQNLHNLVFIISKETNLNYPTLEKNETWNINTQEKEINKYKPEEAKDTGTSRQGF